MTLREEILKYAKKRYNTAPDYPFSTAPSYPVLRHDDNRKWFALIMDIPKEKLGLRGKTKVDVINLKIGDPLLIDMLIHQKGYFMGYHMGRGKWISVLLDGTVPLEDICRLIDESFSVTASKQKKQKIRPPKEWVIPANPKYYDIEHAFDNADEIDWKQGSGIKPGDTVFMYVAAPVSAILYKCKVTKTDIPYNYADKDLTIKAVMKIKLQKRYEPEEFTFDRLKTEYGILAIRGPRGIPNSLSSKLNEDRKTK